MDKVLKAGIKKYIKQVKALLLCDAKTAKCFLSDFENCTFVNDVRPSLEKIKEER